MSGPDLKVVGAFLEFAKRAKELPCAGFHRSCKSCGALEKVGSADVTDEDEITGEGAHRLLGRPRCR